MALSHTQLQQTSPVRSTMVLSIFPSSFIQPLFKKSPASCSTNPTSQSLQIARKATDSALITLPATSVSVPSILISPAPSSQSFEPSSFSPDLDEEASRENIFWDYRAQICEHKRLLHPTLKAATDIKPRTQKYKKMWTRAKKRASTEIAKRQEVKERRRREREEKTKTDRISESDYYRMHEAKGGVADLARKRKMGLREKRNSVRYFKRYVHKMLACGGDVGKAVGDSLRTTLQV
ncbi:MAG: hypothetical protein Q9168_006220 [Polycauliona sp. 1 TL-2023]